MPQTKDSLMDDLKTTRLDFDGIKENLKLFLESQESLRDYNFTGATMNIMVDVLAYTTHYNALYAQQASNETFLDTAILRSSVVSRAKELGYIPRQYTPSKATVDISITVPNTDTSTQLIIPRYTKFTGEKNGRSIPFRNTEQVVLTDRVGDVFTGTVTLFQGENVTERFVFDQNDNNVFVLSPERLYTDLLNVEVLPFVGAGSKQIFTNGANLVNITSDSNVFFWQESINGDVEIFFGDGTLGKSLSSGNEIAVEMFVTLGSEGNGTSSFTVAESINGLPTNSIVVSNIQPSLFGSDRESIDSVKLLAPKSFASQNRLVTLADYRTYIKSTFGNVEAVAVWPGEENIPRTFGRVYISIKPTGSLILTSAEKASILADLGQKSVVGISTTLVDSEIVLVNVNSVIDYNQSIATVSSSQAIELAKNKVLEFFDEALNDFDSELIYSKLVRAIDDADSSICGNLTTITLGKTFTPNEGTGSYVFDFANALLPNTLTSNIWTDGLNNFQLREVDGQVNLYRDGVLLTANVGTVEYPTGIVNIPSFDPSIEQNAAITITVEPTTYNISTRRNNILVSNEINVTI